MKHKSTTTYIVTEEKDFKKYLSQMKREGWVIIDQFIKGIKTTVVFER